MLFACVSIWLHMVLNGLKSVMHEQNSGGLGLGLNPTTAGRLVAQMQKNATATNTVQVTVELLMGP